MNEHICFAGCRCGGQGKSIPTPTPGRAFFGPAGAEILTEGSDGIPVMATPEGVAPMVELGTFSGFIYETEDDSE